MRNVVKQKLNVFFSKLASFKAMWLCYALALIAIACVGFSSWVIYVPASPATVYGESFTVYQVSDSANYIRFESTTGFNYFYSGFTDGSGNILKTGDIKTTVAINDDNISGFLEGGYEITFTLNAGENSSFLGKTTFSYAADSTANQWTTVTAAAVGNSCSAVLQSKDLSGFTDSFCIKFTLDPGESYGELYDFLEGGSTFTLSAMVTPLS